MDKRQLLELAQIMDVLKITPDEEDDFLATVIPLMESGMPANEAWKHAMDGGDKGDSEEEYRAPGKAGRKWSSDAHPRGPDGRFISRGEGQSVKKSEPSSKPSTKQAVSATKSLTKGFRDYLAKIKPADESEGPAAEGSFSDYLKSIGGGKSPMPDGWDDDDFFEILEEDKPTGKKLEDLRPGKKLEDLRPVEKGDKGDYFNLEESPEDEVDFEPIEEEVDFEPVVAAAKKSPAKAKRAQKARTRKKIPAAAGYMARKDPMITYQTTGFQPYRMTRNAVRIGKKFYTRIHDVEIFAAHKRGQIVVTEKTLAELARKGNENAKANHRYPVKIYHEGRERHGFMNRYHVGKGACVVDDKYREAWPVLYADLYIENELMPLIEDNKLPGRSVTLDADNMKIYDVALLDTEDSYFGFNDLYVEEGAMAPANTVGFSALAEGGRLICYSAARKYVRYAVTQTGAIPPAIDGNRKRKGEVEYDETEDLDPVDEAELQDGDGIHDEGEEEQMLADIMTRLDRYDKYLPALEKLDGLIDKLGAGSQPEPMIEPEGEYTDDEDEEVKKAVAAFSADTGTAQAEYRKSLDSHLIAFREEQKLIDEERFSTEYGVFYSKSPKLAELYATRLRGATDTIPGKRSRDPRVSSNQIDQLKQAEKVQISLANKTDERFRADREQELRQYYRANKATIAYIISKDAPISEDEYVKYNLR